MIAGLMLLAWLVITRNFTLDLTFLLFMILCQICLFSWVFAGDYVSSKALSHSFALIASVTVYYAATKCATSALLIRRGAEDIVRALYFALLFTSAFIVVEFLGINGRIPDVTRFVPYTQVVQFKAYAVALVRRPRGFATEPGVMALFYDLALFVVLPLVRKGWGWRLGYYLIIIPAYLALTSTASIAATAVALAALTLWNFRRKFLTTSGQIIALLSVFALVFTIGGLPVRKMLSDQTVYRIATLVTGSGNDSSAHERRGRFIEVENVIESYPLGIGFGVAAGMPEKGGKFRGIEVSSGQVSLIGTFLVSGGLPAGILAGLIIVVTLFRALNTPVFGPYIAAGGLALTIHQMTVTEFWLPYFWLFFALTNAFSEHYPRATHSFTTGGYRIQPRTRIAHGSDKFP
jgi:hypothetical protein